MSRCLTSLRLRWRRHQCSAASCSSFLHSFRTSCRTSKTVRIGCTRSYLVVLNFMFLICGSTVLGLGCWMHLEQRAFIYLEVLHNIPLTGLLALFDRLPSVFIVIGGCVAILSFLGCCGAYADSAFFLCLYTLLICMVLITELIIAILIITYREQILLRVESSLKFQIHYEYDKTGASGNLTKAEADHVTVLVDAMQRKLKCCGAAGPGDYRQSSWYNHSRTKYEVFVPLSCCSTVYNDTEKVTTVKDGDGCQVDAILYHYGAHEKKSDSLNTQGCQRSIVTWFNSNLFILVSIVCLVVTLQVLDLTSACVLMSLVIQKHSDCQWTEEGGSEIG